MKLGGRPKKRPEERCDLRVELRLESSTVKRLDGLARAWGWNRAQLMRAAIKDYIARAKKAA